MLARRSNAAPKGSGGGATAESGLSKLSMYQEQPNEELTLEDFEVYAFDRLAVLRGIDSLRSRGIKGKDLKNETRDLLRKKFEHPLKELKHVRKDLVSHHILRLAYAGSEEKRRWFSTQETALFKFRLEAETQEQLADFMSRHQLTFVQASEEDKLLYADKLRAVFELERSAAMGVATATDDTEGLASEKARSFETEQFYKVEFTQALDLLRHRHVFLAGGFAFVPHSKALSIVVGRFRAYLNKSLVAAYKVLPEVLRDERLAPMLNNISTSYMGPEYGANRKAVEGVTADDVDGLAASSFPLCMQALHDGLKEAHHLKHSGRQQYGLFLKGVGLSLEDALIFWQREFSKKMAAEAFLKQYAYNIRHNYGKEGKRTDYTPLSCAKIVNGAPPGNGEHHGCPYKHWDANRLRSVLTKMKLTGPAVDGIMETKRSGDFQVACRKQFEARFVGSIAANVGNHPNAYVEEAQKYIKAAAAASSSSAAVAGEAAAFGAGASPSSPAAGGAAAASSPSAAVSPVGAAAGAVSPSGSGAPSPRMLEEIAALEGMDQDELMAAAGDA